MSVVRDGDMAMIVCDGCGTESDCGDFHDLIGELKGDGWKIRNNDGRWTHHCTSCDSGVSRLEIARRKFGR